MAVDFPSSPSDGQKLSAADALHVYDSSKGFWKATPTTSGIQLASLGVTAPADASGSGGISYNNTTGDFTYTPPVLSAGFGATVYATAADLPLSGNTAGDQAYVTATNRLYLWTGTGWYNIALINTAPTITTGSAATYALNAAGDTVITLVATDPEDVPITWSYAVTSGSLGSSATVSQADNVFTVTAAGNGAFSLTFTASDGINLATSTSAFTITIPFAGTVSRTLYNDVGGTMFGGSRGGIQTGAVAISADYVAVGRPTDKVYLYSRSTGNQVYQIDLPSGGNGIGNFGDMVGMHGNYLAVTVKIPGAPYASQTFVYDISTFSSSTITSANHVLNHGATNLSNEAPVVDGNYIAISDPFYDNPASDSGAVHLYDMSTISTYSVGAANYLIKNPNVYGTANSDYFSKNGAIAIHGDNMVVGAELEDSATQGSGAAYVYDISTFSSSTITTARYSLTNPNSNTTNAADSFGTSVDISGDRVVVSAPKEETAQGTDSGAVYVYALSDGLLDYTLPCPSGGSGKQFGRVLKMHGDDIWAGEYVLIYAAVNGSHRLYHYDASTFSSSTITTPTNTIANPNLDPNLSDHDGWPANIQNFEGALLAVAAKENATDGSGGTSSNSGVVYIFT
jgi:hypothetical protein